MPNKPLQSTSIVSPGFFGLNSQDSGVSMEQSFALIATNAVIDKSGRIAARKGWTYRTTSGGSSSSPKAIFEFSANGAGYTIISAGNGKLFTGETTMTEKPVRNSDDTANLTYTITSDNWQIVQGEFDTGLNRSPHAYLVQANHPALIYHKLGSTVHAHTGDFGFQRLGDMGSVPTGYTTSTFMPNCALAAYGRLWVADIGSDDLTVYYSVLLDNSNFNGIGSGYINLEQVVPGGDRIVALAEHNNFLIIFCEQNIVIYSNANDIDNLVLSDVISGVGCAARDSVQNIGTDVLFLSNSGIRSIGRTIQEKSSPIKDISRNVRDQLLSYVGSENMALIRSVYYEPEAMYLITMPTSGFTFCFDLRQFLEDGSARATFWNNIAPLSLCATHDRRLLLGKPDGIALYKGYKDNTAPYTFSYYTPYLDFQSPSIVKMLKKLEVTVIGGANSVLDIRYAFDYQTNFKTVRAVVPGGTTAEYGIAEYNIDEYAASIFIDSVRKQLSGSGNVVQIGIDAIINGKSLSIQKLNIYAVSGRTI
jgi:hypothetical protein